MVLTALTANQNTYNGSVAVTEQAVDVANGNSFPHSNNLVLLFQETGGTNTLTVTITSNTDSKGFSKTVTGTIPADGELFVGPLDKNFSKNGKVEVSYTGSGTGNVYAVIIEPVK